jgi:hypothetical protein
VGGRGDGEWVGRWGRGGGGGGTVTRVAGKSGWEGMG